MAIFDNWFRKEAETKSAIDINSPRLLEMIQAGMGGSSGESAMRIGAVYSCVKVLSESVSTLPVNLYDLDGDLRTKKPTQLDRLVAAQPNDNMTANELWQYVVTSVCLHGNAYVYVTRTAKGRAVELLPIPATSVSIHIANQNTVTYVVTVGEKPNTREIKMTSRELLHFKSLTLDGYTGISPISYNNAIVGGSRAAMDYANNIYTNGATPRGVLEVEGTLSDDAFTNLKDSWQGAHGGSNNGNRVALLESGVKFKPITMSPHDVQLLESRKYSRSEIAGIFRVPGHMINDLDKATYSNIAHQGAEFYRYSLSPWLTMIEQRLNMTMAGPNQCFKFDVSELIRGDVEAEVSAYSKLLEIGVLSPNEVRAKFGMNPRDGGDEFVSASNNLTFGDEESPEEPTEDPKNEESI
jgi:HK97 family phage portal protein